MASTHTELYRRFAGTRTPARWPWIPIAVAAIRTATKRKLPLLLFAPPAIATVIFSFIVYAKFALESGTGAGPIPSAGAGMAGVAAMAGKLIEVREQINQFNLAMSVFAILILGWYGSGLIAEDRRLGAHLLYFARPLTRADYLVGKFVALSYFGILAVLVPSLVICLIAAFSSPDWSFVTQEGDVILGSVAFAITWVVAMASIVLAISSLCDRKTFALVGTFAFFLLTNAVAVLLAKLQHESRYFLISLQGNLRRLAGALLATRSGLGEHLDWDPTLSWVAVAGFVALAWCILWRRVSRMEAVQ